MPVWSYRRVSSVIRRTFGFGNAPSARERDFEGASMDAAPCGGALHPSERARPAMNEIKMGRQVINDPSCRVMIYELPLGMARRGNTADITNRLKIFRHTCQYHCAWLAPLICVDRKRPHVILSPLEPTDERSMPDNAAALWPRRGTVRMSDCGRGDCLSLGAPQTA